VTLIKICGVTRPDDAARVAAAGVDFIGLNFWPRSRRAVAPERAPELAGAARGAGTARIVGVFVDAAREAITAIAQAAQLDAIQLHGDEAPEDLAALSSATGLPVWKALAIGAPGDLEELDRWRAEVILLDAPQAGRGGGGVRFDWALAAAARRRAPAQRIALAGGLDPDNVAAAIAQVAPYAVDVATGVEAAPGVKDPVKLAAFVAAVRGATR
jgi:phosphoribosylanthranilate isomerase